MNNTMATQHPDDSVRAWTFDELVRDGLSSIPAYAPQWTQHNVSDPGITLVELFAYVTEILAYRALRVTPDAKLYFLRLLDGGRTARTDALRGGSSAAIDAAIAQRVHELSQVECAVTPHDFEQLAVNAARERLGPDAAVRAMAVPGVDLRPAAQRDLRAAVRPGDISLVLAPERELNSEALAELLRHVEDTLTPRCLLTSRLHVVRPIYLQVSVGCRLALHWGATWDATLDAIDASLEQRFGAGTPGQSSPRPFGMPLHLAEVIEAIDRSEGVDYVEDLILWGIESNSEDDSGEADDGLGGRIGVRIGRAASPGVDSRLGGRISLPARRLRLDAAGGVESVQLHAWEQVRVRLARDAVEEIDDADGDVPGERRGQ
jgi:hypothetical protein